MTHRQSRRAGHVGGGGFGEVVGGVTSKLPPNNRKSNRSLRLSTVPEIQFSGVFECLAEFLGDLVVVVAGQRMTRADGQRNRPVDDLEYGQTGQRAVIGEMLGSRNPNPADDRKGDGKGFGVADSLHGGAVRDVTRRLFGHCLPFRHGVFNGWRLGLGNSGNRVEVVEGLSSDPLTIVVARVLTFPLRELYAVL